LRDEQQGRISGLLFRVPGKLLHGYEFRRIHKKKSEGLAKCERTIKLQISYLGEKYFIVSYFK
jgi:hypothetical protein